jgi:hypothetical protein
MLLELLNYHNVDALLMQCAWFPYDNLVSRTFQLSHDVI